MSSAVADPVAAMVAILLADADTAALVGVGVYGGELPPAVTAQMEAHAPHGAIVLRASGGVSITAGSFVEHDTARVDLFAYGRTPQEAGQIAQTAALCLRRVRPGVWAQVHVHWIKPAGGYSSGREPGTEWPRAWQSWQIFHGLVPVA